MYSGSITDVKGIKVGHYTDKENKTGATVILAEEGATCGVEVRGCAPGTRETDIMRNASSGNKAHAIVLTGGSAFGLECASGVMRYLKEKGIGVQAGNQRVPIVGSAVIFDLDNGNFAFPDVKAGIKACENATERPDFGSVGAGCGATVGKVAGLSEAGGIGSASIELAGGVVVAAAFVVNAVGDIYDHRTGEIIAGANDGNGNHIGLLDAMLKANDVPELVNQNTVIGVVATNAKLTKEETNKVASIAHDGIALSVRPAHTLYDGDTVFALSLGEKQGNLAMIMAAAAEVSARAIENAVKKG